MLGDRNWWLPGWLDRIIPHVNVEGSTDADPDDGDPTEEEPHSHPQREPEPV
ncbi:MAG: hypothetical protein M5U19_09205 [Microthrixaceae bacterium]|nr:hypothetical protein [Microthrixaceae bacterium]